MSIKHDGDDPHYASLGSRLFEFFSSLPNGSMAHEETSLFHRGIPRSKLYCTCRDCQNDVIELNGRMGMLSRLSRTVKSSTTITVKSILMERAVDGLHANNFL